MGKRNLDVADVVEGVVNRLSFLAMVFGTVNPDQFAPSRAELVGLADLIDGIVAELNGIDGMWEESS